MGVNLQTYRNTVWFVHLGSCEISQRWDWVYIFSFYETITSSPKILIQIRHGVMPSWNVLKIIGNMGMDQYLLIPFLVG